MLGEGWDGTKLAVRKDAGKPEGIHLHDRPPALRRIRQLDRDRQMLEYTKAGDDARFAMLVLHDDAKREYAYGPAQGLPDTRVGAFTQALYDEAKKNGWIVISMKNDWKRIFAFENWQWGRPDANPSLTPLILFAASPGTITGVITLSVAHAKSGIPVTALVAVTLGIT